MMPRCAMRATLAFVITLLALNAVLRVRNGQASRDELFAMLPKNMLLSTWMHFPRTLHVVLVTSNLMEMVALPILELLARLRVIASSQPQVSSPALPVLPWETSTSARTPYALGRSAQP